MITERQTEILNTIVREYINSAQPVSSQLLEKKYDFKVCPATIRAEMQRLTNGDFLHQPHTSAGRVPTDKGYRFFVDELLENGWGDLEKEFGIDWEKEVEDSLGFIQTITKFLASESSNLALSYLSRRKILWKEGWGEILQEPEFEERGYAWRFTQMLDDFEKNIESFLRDFSSGIEVYIGKENPFPKSKDFSTIVYRCCFPNREKRVLAILGPKRMNYEKNIGSLNYLAKLLEEI